MIALVNSPGTVDAGDIMMVGRHFYIGLSERTNQAGATQVIEILNRHGLTGSTVQLEHVLHLKSGVAYLEHNRLVVAGEFVDRSEVASYELIKVDDDEQYAANCLWVNDIVLVPSGFPKITSELEALGLEIIQLEMTEFQKVDGGLSCLSLRF